MTCNVRYVVMTAFQLTKYMWLIVLSINILFTQLLCIQRAAHILVKAWGHKPPTAADGSLPLKEEKEGEEEEEAEEEEVQ